LQKQDRAAAYGMTGGMFGRKRKLLEKWTHSGFALDEDLRGIVVLQEESLDIDTAFDFEVFAGVITLRNKIKEKKR